MTDLERAVHDAAMAWRKALAEWHGTPSDLGAGRTLLQAEERLSDAVDALSTEAVAIA